MCYSVASTLSTFVEAHLLVKRDVAKDVAKGVACINYTKSYILPVDIRVN